MAVKDIVDGHHVLRHCRTRLVDTSDPNDLQPFPEAFELKSKEKYLSASYYEYFSGTHDERLRESLVLLARRFNGIKDDDALLMMNAGEIRSCGRKQDLQIRVVFQPTQGKPDYAGIRQMPSPPNAALNALLATVAVRDLVLVKQLT